MKLAEFQHLHYKATAELNSTHLSLSPKILWKKCRTFVTIRDSDMNSD